MGAFFTNVQARGASVDALIAAIREAAGEVDEVGEDGTPDRTVLVLPQGEAGWTAIYDEATEDQSGALDALAKLASKVGTHAVAVTVHDSDILALSLFQGGERIDRYDSAPDYYEPNVSADKRAALAGSPSKWLGVLPFGGGESVLAEAFATKEPFAERTLSRVAKLLGWEHAKTGYRYAVSDGDVLPAGTVTLRFRDRARPDDEFPFTGPPSFSMHGYGGTGKRMTYPMDEPLALSVAFRNEGGDGKGLMVSAWGSALDEGLVAIERFELVLGSERRRVMLEPERTKSTDGLDVTAGEAPDLTFEAGTPPPRSMKALEAFIKARERGMVHVHVHARALKEGQGELWCGLVPRENSEGSDGHRFQLAVTPPSASAKPASPSGRSKKATKKAPRRS